MTEPPLDTYMETPRWRLLMYPISGFVVGLLVFGAWAFLR